MWLPLVKSGRNQRLFDQTGDGVKDLCIVGALSARDVARSLEAEMFDKAGNSSQDDSLHTRQQIVTPIQRCLERLMPGERRSMSSFEQLEPRCQTSVESKTERERQRQAEGLEKPGKPAGPLSDEPNPKSQRNFTNPESRIMKSRDGFVQANYDVQAAVDAGA